jgi:hypothetical protein
MPSVTTTVNTNSLAGFGPWLTFARSSSERLSYRQKYKLGVSYAGHYESAEVAN